MATANAEQMINTTVSKIHELRDQVRQQIRFGATELKETWLALEMRLADVEKQRVRSSRDKLAALYELQGAWQALHTRLCIGLVQARTERSYSMASSA